MLNLLAKNRKKNNSFYGKHHSKETKQKICNLNSVISKKLWQNEDYRQKVISSTTGKKRSGIHVHILPNGTHRIKNYEAFRETQRRNAYKQFEDKKQRELRSIKMKQSWAKGRISPHSPNGHNFSKQELKFGEDLKKALNENGNFLKRNQVIKLPNSSKFYLPDFLYKEKCVIEYLGDYWHVNPKKYKANDYIEFPGGKLQAKEIWEKDEKRRKQIQSLAYIVIEVWGSDYANNPETCIENILKQISVL